MSQEGVETIPDECKGVAASAAKCTASLQRMI